MTKPPIQATRSLPSRPSLESIRKQAKKLARDFAVREGEALTRVRAQLATADTSLSQRDAQLVIAREYGFSGWQALKTEVLSRTGKGLETAGRQARRVIHESDTDQLRTLLKDFPALTSWRDANDETLLAFAANSFGDSGDASRERMFTRLQCAEILLDAGATIDLALWQAVVASRAHAMLQLFWKKDAVPRILPAFVEAGEQKGFHTFDKANDTIDLPFTLHIFAAIGELSLVRKWLDTDHNADDLDTLNKAFMTACRWRHADIASMLLDHCLRLDAKLESQLDRSGGRDRFIEYFAEHAHQFGAAWASKVVTPWQTLIVNEAMRAVREDDEPSFNRWLQSEPWLLDEAHVEIQIELIENATLNDRGSIITKILSLDPALARLETPPKTQALEFAFEYGHAHLIALLTRVWPFPDDLPHAAGVGDSARVRHWFGDSGRPALGDLKQHFPVNVAHASKNLQWDVSPEQQILDVALAWACMNKHFEIAQFLLDHGANINTNWSTHEPASILHECAIQGNYEAAQFLIDRGIDATILDHRWNGTAAGWAYNAAKDEKMGDLLFAAQERQEKARGPTSRDEE